MATWTNWAGTVSADVTRATPAAVADIAKMVGDATARGERVKPVGAGHSFTAIAATDGIQLDLERLAGIVQADRETGVVTVLAGTRLRALNEALWHLGLSMSNLGDVDVQTIGGALSTGTHGTGAKLGGLATQVVALDLVLADGSQLHCSAAEHPDVFAAARIGLGALGVITSVTLQCEPAFALAASEAPAPLDDVLEDLDDYVLGNDHFEFYWFPHTRRVLTKRNNRVLPDTRLRPVGRFRHWVDDEFLANTVFDRLNRLTTRRPGLIPRANAVAARLLTPRDYIDRAHRVFTSPRRVRFTEMEYAVPRPTVPFILEGIERHLARSREQVGFPVEVRFAAADDIWLSTAHRRDTAYVAVHQYHRRQHEPYFRAVEELAVEVGGRPHWGKIHYRGATELAGSYPHFADFVAVRERLDPQRTFGNEYLERVLGG
jgi:FAD-linked oxidoreductase